MQTGGAPHAAASVRAWLDDGVMLIDGYGMSEAGTVLGMPPGDLDLLGRKAGAAGLPAIGVEVRLVDRESNDVGEGEIGEVWVRGPSVSPGYWRNPEATDAAFRDGWFRSGDAARRDADGFYTLVDRWKDMFISGGENVYPAEVEAAILEIDGVAEVAVIGAPDPRWGETGVAFVVCRAGAAIAGEQVIAHCRARLAAYKAPKNVVLAEGLPRTASGKVQKAALREIWARGKT
jgi:fatty-acyl-CoA synthase